MKKKYSLLSLHLKFSNILNWIMKERFPMERYSFNHNISEIDNKKQTGYLKRRQVEDDLKIYSLLDL